jgi:hypothetical protein
MALLKFSFFFEGLATLDEFGRDDTLIGIGGLVL